MTRINLNRINALRSIQGSREFLAWGKNGNAKNLNTNNFQNIQRNILGNANALIFAAVLIACSITVGCTSDKPKSISATSQIPAPQVPSATAPISAPVLQAENKPAPKKVVHKKPATVNYTDKNYGVTFEYPRRYAIETGDAATDLLTSSPVPMNFVQPGGVALAAVELPETGYANTDFSSAFFDVSVHKNLTADQCSEFAVPQPKVMPASMSTTSAEASTANTAAGGTTSTQAEAQSVPTATAIASSDAKASAEQQSDTKVSNATAADSSASNVGSSNTSSNATSSASEAQGSKLVLGDLELRATEAVSGEGTRQSDAKYFHIYRNGACYEFAVNVTTVASEDGITKHVDRDRVFANLEKILATVKIDEVKNSSATTPEVNAATPAAAQATTSTQATSENPAQ
jgi:hypothetical protein